MTTCAITTIIRPMSPDDAPFLADIDRQCSSDPLDADDFRVSLMWSGVFGLVAEYADHPCGFLIGQHAEDGIDIWNIGTISRRLGVGRSLVEAAKGKLGPRRQRVTADVRETNVTAQLFFKACGFRWEWTVKGGCPTGEDVYRMVGGRGPG